MNIDALVRETFACGIRELAGREIVLVPDQGAFRRGGVGYGTPLDGGDFLRVTMEDGVASFSLYAKSNARFACDLDHDGSVLTGTVDDRAVAPGFEIDGIDVADLFGRIRELVSSASIEQAPVRMRYAEELRAAA
jgi:hypothetical protein